MARVRVGSDRKPEAREVAEGIIQVHMYVNLACLTPQELALVAKIDSETICKY